MKKRINLANIIAVLTLALGISANTVVFSIARTVLLRPLGFEASDRLMWLQLVKPSSGATEDRFSWQDMEDIRALTKIFESLSTFGNSGALWERNQRMEEIPTLSVTPDLFSTLRVKPVLGRMIESADIDPGAAPVAMMSYELWQEQFGGRTDTLGQSLRFEEKSRTIVGILPPGLQFPLLRNSVLATGDQEQPGRQSFWFPFPTPKGSDRFHRGARMFMLIGRLRDGVTESEARVELQALSERLAKEFPETNRDARFNIVSLRDQILGHTRRGLPLLGFAVAAVLLICCINLANLLLARGIHRERELAVRAALGCSRWRLARLLLRESILLALVGGGLGLLLAELGLYGIRLIAIGNVPFIQEVKLDAVVLLFTTGVALASAMIFGLLPALRQARVDAATCLRSGPRTTGTLQVRAWQRGLLIGQTAIVLILLTSAALLLESFRRLLSQDLGYRPGSVLMIDLNTWGFATNGDVCRFYRVLQARLKSLPGVKAVGTVSSAPLTGRWPIDEKADVLDRPLPVADRPSLAATFVAFDYFQAMGIPLVEGRFFRDSELNDDGYGQIVIVNEAAANVLFPGRSAVGGRFTVGSNPDRILEIVGVVKDTRDVRLEEAPQPRFYWQYAFGGAQLIIRCEGPVSALIPVVRDVVQQSDARLLKQTLQPMTEVVASTVAERRFLTTLLIVYAVLALTIAAVGIFGVAACLVASRTKEFGVRLALGATPTAVLRLVLLQATRPVAIGLFIGAMGSLGVNRLLTSQLFGLSPHNPFLMGGVSGLLLLVALAATYIPARRAARTDPVETLKDL